MSNERCACKKCETALFGVRPDQTDGVVWISTNNSQTLHGTPENPGGIVKIVMEHERLKLKAVGIVAAIGMFFTIINGLIVFWPKILKLLNP